MRWQFSEFSPSRIWSFFSSPFCLTSSFCVTRSYLGFGPQRYELAKRECRVSTHQLVQAIHIIQIIPPGL